jgi:hypothetical protein
MSASRLDTPLGMSVQITDDLPTVELKDGRVINTPLIWYPRLHKATAAQRAVWEWHGDGVGITWPQLDEDLSIQGMLEGNPSIEYERHLAK